MNIGILHPGAMGTSIAASIQNSGHDVYWLSEGRSQASHEHAAKQHLIDAGSLEVMCSSCQFVISICPPEAAEQVAQQVMAHEYHGTYVDANAISPQRVIKMAEAFSQRNINFIDGGVVGPPAWKDGTTWLHLSGENVKELLELFKSGPINTNILGTEYGMASALKMCFAAYTKGKTAMLLSILALADNHGVKAELETQWDALWPDFTQKTQSEINNALPKAWRFSGEMAEIASTFAAADLPNGFHKSAEDIFQALREYKDIKTNPDINEVISLINK